MVGLTNSVFAIWLRNPKDKEQNNYRTIFRLVDTKKS